MLKRFLGPSLQWLSDQKAFVSPSHRLEMRLPLPRSPSPRSVHCAPFPVLIKNSFFFLFFSLCLFFCVFSDETRHRRVTIRSDHFYFIVRKALAECSLPRDCVPEVERALLDRTQVPHCNGTDYFPLLGCLDAIILTRTNLTELNSRAGRVCCEVEQVSLSCQLACRSALFSPTLSHHQKQKRIEMVCHLGHGTEIRGDKGVLNCLKSTRQWLPQRHELKN